MQDDKETLYPDYVRIGLTEDEDISLNFYDLHTDEDYKKSAPQFLYGPQRSAQDSFHLYELMKNREHLASLTINKKLAKRLLIELARAISAAEPEGSLFGGPIEGMADDIAGIIDDE